MALCAAFLGAAAIAAGGARGGGPLPTGEDAFFQAGTQPLMPGVAPLEPALQCSICHGNYEPEQVPGRGDPDNAWADFLTYEPSRLWQSTMLGQSARDPVFWAALVIANQDVEGAGQFCMRCHVPGAFLNGRHLPADGSAVTGADFDGVSCVICHRMVDPVYKPGISPAVDQAILAALDAEGLIPPQSSNARYIIDPTDSRRGPYSAAGMPFNPHFGSPAPPIIESPFHNSSEFCWTCHDVSNPLVVRNPDDTYSLGDTSKPHPTGDHHEMFPLHRTFAEWKNSYYFTQGGVPHFGRFGGNHPTGIVSTCQDCHMPQAEAFGCNLPGFPLRNDLGAHSFAGSNTWVMRAIHALFDTSQSGLTDELVEASVARNRVMLEKASDLTLTQYGSTLRARLINQTGHKLPTGFPDGRRVWINVRFLDSGGELIAERGGYDLDSGRLIDDGDDTVVFETILGIDEAQSKLVGKPVGKTFHFLLANTILKDNRIPPRGFSNTLAVQAQTASVGATYQNGQHWYDADFPIPAPAREVVVTVYHQVTSGEFAEFLRDANTTDSQGDDIYALWQDHGGRLPTVMDSVAIQLSNPADLNGDGEINFDDLLLLLSWWGDCPIGPPLCIYDLDGDGTIGFADLLLLMSAWGAS